MRRRAARSRPVRAGRPPPGRCRCVSALPRVTACTWANRSTPTVPRMAAQRWPSELTWPALAAMAAAHTTVPVMAPSPPVTQSERVRAPRAPAVWAHPPTRVRACRQRPGAEGAGPGAEAVGAPAHLTRPRGRGRVRARDTVMAERPPRAARGSRLWPDRRTVPACGLLLHHQVGGGAGGTDPSQAGWLHTEAAAAGPGIVRLINSITRGRRTAPAASAPGPTRPRPATGRNG